MSDTQILPHPPTAMLKAVHNRMRELFAQYDTLGPEAWQAKKGIFHEIQDGLRIHLEIEEVLFYPAVQAMGAALAVSVVMRALQTHRQVKAILAELRVLNSDNQSLDARMEGLEECVLPHLLVEEKEIFPHARLLPEETLRELSIEMERLRDRLRADGGRS